MSTTTTPATDAPTSDVDLFSAEVLADPYPTFRALRDAGPVVRLTQYPTYVISRYDDVRAALRDPASFSSGDGVALTDQSNAAMAGNVIATDPPHHAALRGVLDAKLSPRAIRGLRADIEQRADRLVADAVARGRLDAVGELTARFPVEVVADLIGLPAEGREVLLPGADAIFCSLGPANEIFQRKFPALMALQSYMEHVFDRDVIAPDSWGSYVLDLVDAGQVSPRQGLMFIGAFLTAGMDTTVHGLTNYVRVLADDPALFAHLREHPERVGPVFEEVLRHDSPVSGLFRTVTTDVVVDGATIPAGARAFLLYASANHDERHYADPDRFDPARAPFDHLAFGFGAHGCVGQSLARMEATALVTSLLRRVHALHVTGEIVRYENTITRGIAHLPLEFEAATA